MNTFKVHFAIVMQLKNNLKLSQAWNKMYRIKFTHLSINVLL